MGYVLAAIPLRFGQRLYFIQDVTCWLAVLHCSEDAECEDRIYGVLPHPESLA